MDKTLQDQTLSEKQIIRLHRDLVAPVTVHEILSGAEDFDEEVRYALDVMLAEMQPDTALIAIALCAAHIAERHANALPIASSLGFEASRIVEEFGPAWIAHADRRLTIAHENMVIDLLDQMPEDFEALADLLDAVEVQLPANTAAAELCDMLAETARSFIDYIEYQNSEPVVIAEPLTREDLKAFDNVVAFPKMARH